MKRGKLAMMAITCALASAGLTAQAQITPGSVLGFSRDVKGTLAVNSVSPAGCPTQICTTNYVTSVHCYTNCFWRLVCTTNTAGDVHCTNVLVCPARCYTNTFPQVTCTNVFLDPTSLIAKEGLNGDITANAPCDELDGLFPANAVLHASLYANVRTNDWRGSHSGSFTILVGTNVVAVGSLSGVNGVGSHRGLEACALCNHLEGTLRGSITLSGPLHGARITASYSGDLPGVACPRADVPAGAISLSIDGTVVTACPRHLLGSMSGL